MKINMIANTLYEITNNSKHYCNYCQWENDDGSCFNKDIYEPCNFKFSIEGAVKMADELLVLEEVKNEPIF